MQMVVIRRNQEPELETNETQKQEEVLRGSIVQKNTIYIHGRSSQSKLLLMIQVIFTE